MARIALTPLFAVSLYRHHTGEALILFSIACITDTLDGILARRFQQRTELGALLDALADKILLTVAYLMMAFFPGDSPNVIPLWLTTIIIVRDLIILMGGWLLRRRNPKASLPPTIWGKWSTTFQMSVIVLALIGNAWNLAIPMFSIVVWGALLLTLISGFHYGIRAVCMIRRGEFDPSQSPHPPAI